MSTIDIEAYEVCITYTRDATEKTQAADSGTEKTHEAESGTEKTFDSTYITNSAVIVPDADLSPTEWTLTDG